MGYQIGDMVCGRYEVLGILPPHSTGELYRAHQRELGVDVVLLVVGPPLLPDEASRQTFAQRVGLARGLRQSHLVWLYDVRPDGDRVVVAAQWVGVDTLRARMEARKTEKIGWPLPVEESWGIVQQVAYAVVQMHRDAEVLGDLRADTILVTPEGLKLFNHGVGTGLPRPRFVEALERAGEDASLAPEVRAGGSPSARADVYSLAALAFELFFGSPPSPSPPALTATRPKLFAALQHALNLEPFERPLSIDALLRELESTLSEPVQALPVAAATNDEWTPEPSASPVAPRGGKEWGGNENVTRELHVDDLESLLGKNETRQINLDEIEALLAKSKDPSIDATAGGKAVAAPTKEDQPKPEAKKESKPDPRATPEEVTLPPTVKPVDTPTLFNTGGQDAPVILLRPEDKKTGMMAPVDVESTHALAGTAPPPTWEDVKSKLTPKRAGGRLGWAMVAGVGVVVAGLVAAAWYYGAGPGAGGGATSTPPPSTTGTSGAVTPTPPPIVVEPAHAPAPTPAPTVAAVTCPAGMVGIGGTKPFCVDQYESPGAGQLPRVQVGFVEAVQLCGARGGRLCSETEWDRACRGPDGAAYPYGAKFTAARCNVKGGAGRLVPAGSFAQCKSAVGAFDMTGNAAEWVIVEPQQVPAVKGGSAVSGDPVASCAHRVETTSLAGAPLVGFRCCRDAK